MSESEIVQTGAEKVISQGTISRLKIHRPQNGILEADWSAKVFKGLIRKQFASKVLERIPSSDPDHQ